MHTKKTIEFYNASAQTYFSEWKDNELLMPLLKLLVSDAGVSPKILDLGCGPGTEARRLAGLGAEVTGIDLSKESLELAGKHAPDVRFLEMDVLSLDFPEKSFYAVLDAAVLFHFSDEEQVEALRNIHGILQDQGKLLSIYPEGNYCGLRDAEVNGLKLSRYVNLKSFREWTRLASENGFSQFRRLDFEFRSFRAALFTK